MSLSLEPGKAAGEAELAEATEALDPEDPGATAGTGGGSSGVLTPVKGLANSLLVGETCLRSSGEASLTKKTSDWYMGPGEGNSLYLMSGEPLGKNW